MATGKISTIGKKVIYKGYSIPNVRSSANLQIVTNSLNIAVSGYKPISAMVVSSWDDTLFNHWIKITNNTLYLNSLHLGTTSSTITVGIGVTYIEDNTVST